MERYKWNEWITSLTAFLKHRVYPTLSPTLLPTFHVPVKDKENELKHKTFNKDGKCVFCVIHLDQDMLYEDDLVVAFIDLKTIGKYFIQVIPKSHIKNIHDLNVSHISLIERMWDIGKKLLEEKHPNSKYIFGFHVPPRNSINHLHMHCIVLPIRGICNKISHNNWLWLMSPKDVLIKLKKAQKRLLSSSTCNLNNQLI